MPSVALFKNSTLIKEKKLLTERRKVIFDPYGEKPAVIRLLPNVGCGFPSRRNHFAKFHLYRANNVWVTGPRKLGVPIDLRGELYNSYSSAVMKKYPYRYVSDTCPSNLAFQPQTCLQHRFYKLCLNIYCLR